MIKVHNPVSLNRLDQNSRILPLGPRLTLTPTLTPPRPTPLTLLTRTLPIIHQLIILLPPRCRFTLRPTPTLTPRPTPTPGTPPPTALPTPIIPVSPPRRRFTLPLPPSLPHGSNDHDNNGKSNKGSKDLCSGGH